MSDDESFVILGSSPLSSLMDNQDENAFNNFNSLCDSQVKQNLDDAKEVFENSKAENSAAEKIIFGNSSAKDVTTAVFEESTEKSIEKDVGQYIAEKPAAEMIISENASAKVVTTAVIEDLEKSTEKSIEKDIGQSIAELQRNASTNSSRQSSLRSAGIPDQSLAASFILGEIDADVLKTSVYSQFPSMCSIEACADDVVKLQSFMSEYVDLKTTLAKVNEIMKQFYVQAQKWRDETSILKENHQQKMHELQMEIAKLRNENNQLNNEVNTKLKQIQICDEMRRQDHAEMRQSISEKTAQIDNMRAVIEKIEQDQLQSYECVSNLMSDNNKKSDYVDLIEHQGVIKDFERKASQMLAENLELKDMQKQYIDEINCLKVNLAAAEELISVARADIQLLKATDVQQSAAFNEYQADRDQMRDELALLRQQLDIYSKDFEMERIARQNLAGEKDQLLQDLRNMQQKNQKLIDNAQVQLVQKMENSGAEISAPVQAPTIKSVANNLTTGAIPKVNTPLVKHAAVTMTTAVSEAQRPIRVLPPNIMSAAQNAPSNVHICPICFKSVKSVTILQSHVNMCLDRN